jgi:hypothetical protein
MVSLKLWLPEKLTNNKLTTDGTILIHLQSLKERTQTEATWEGMLAGKQRPSLARTVVLWPTHIMMFVFDQDPILEKTGGRDTTLEWPEGVYRGKAVSIARGGVLRCVHYAVQTPDE